MIPPDGRERVSIRLRCDRERDTTVRDGVDPQS